MLDAAALSPGPPREDRPDPALGIALLVVATILHAGAGTFLAVLFRGVQLAEMGKLVIAFQFLFAVIAGAVAYRMWEEGGGRWAAIALGGFSLAFLLVVGGMLLALIVGAAPALLEIIGGLTTPRPESPPKAPLH